MAKNIELPHGFNALVDDEDFDWLNKYGWYRTPCGYATRRVWAGTNRQVGLLMHREILGVEPGEEVDHINADRLDNRKENLRVVTRSQNMMNRRKIKAKTSVFKGVCWKKSHKSWQVAIRVNKKLIHLGYFKDEVEAARAYNEAAKNHFGEYARPNQIPGDVP